jgi:hypothetical protein
VREPSELDVWLLLLLLKDVVVGRRVADSSLVGKGQELLVDTVGLTVNATVTLMKKRIRDKMRGTTRGFLETINFIVEIARS